MKLIASFPGTVYTYVYIHVCSYHVYCLLPETQLQLYSMCTCTCRVRTGARMCVVIDM